MKNPLISERDLEFQLYEVLDAGSLPRLPWFAGHSRETFDGYIEICRRFAREVLYPSYREIDETPPELKDGRVTVHPKMREIWPGLRELGVIAATRPASVGGAQLPLTIGAAAGLHLMAGNLSAIGFAGLTTGAAHLVESFAAEPLKARYLPAMVEGRWTGTMALTEPQAGSSLADVRTRATPSGDHWRLSGAKIFISGGDHDLAENIVHMVLARIDGEPAGIKGVSLFLVPKKRPAADGTLEPNDVAISGLIHKIGWRGLPSVALSLGEHGDCRGWLVGAKNQGIAAMFQMMNEARIMVGANAIATASVAWHQSLAYARERTQGRPLAQRDPASPPVAIVEHADVRRMLLRQKAIVEAGIGLVLHAAKLADLAEHGEESGRARAKLLLDLLTPVVKSFPAEKGFESNALAVQIHGGYGYSSEYLPEAWLRDQKLNSIHEGTTGIQGMDLLGRKVVAQGGAALMAFAEEVSAACARAEKAGVDGAWIRAVREAGEKIGALTMELGMRGAGGDVEGMMRHSSDYLELFSTWVAGWQWLVQAAVAREGIAAGRTPSGFYEGKLAAAQYWIRTEIPRIDALVTLCRENEDSYARVRPEWL
jgi:alkylation response protein AidB-like acyl-CoA dehydrogenase